MLTQAKDVVQQHHMGRAQLHGIAESLGVSSADTVSNITERLVGASFARLASKPGKCGEEVAESKLEAPFSAWMRTAKTTTKLWIRGWIR